MFEIIKNAPDIPDIRGRRAEYPLAQLNLHDAFDVKCVEAERLITRNRLHSAVAYYRRKNPDTRFSVRGTEDGIRVRREA